MLDRAILRPLKLRGNTNPGPERLLRIVLSLCETVYHKSSNPWIWDQQTAKVPSTCQSSVSMQQHNRFKVPAGHFDDGSISEEAKLFNQQLQEAMSRGPKWYEVS